MTQTLQKGKVAAKWVPHQLNEEQKAVRKRVAEELLRRYEAEGEQFLNRIVTVDETWIQDFEPQMKSQSSQWKHATPSRPKKCRCQQSKVKLMIIMAYDKNGVIATDRVPPGSTVTAAYNRKFLQDVLLPKICQKSPPCSQPVSSLWMIMRGLMPQVQYPKFWKIWMASASPPAIQSWHEPTRLWLVPKIEETTPWETLQKHWEGV